jgi:hypothetical protein
VVLEDTCHGRLPTDLAVLFVGENAVLHVLETSTLL